MNEDVFYPAGAYMVHDIGPARFAHIPLADDDWRRSVENAQIAEQMKAYGLTDADVLVHLLGEDGMRQIATDAGNIVVHDASIGEGTLARIREMFEQVAGGVAQRRMVKLSGWRAKKGAAALVDHDLLAAARPARGQASYAQRDLERRRQHLRRRLRASAFAACRRRFHERARPAERPSCRIHTSSVMGRACIFNGTTVN